MALLGACSSEAPDDLFSSSEGTEFVPEAKPEAGVSSCDLTGKWATFVEVGVGWESGTIKPGAGTVKQWILGDRRADGAGVLETARACGIGAQGVPLGSPWFATKAFPSLGLDNEWTGVEFSASLFDGPPRVAIPIELGGPDPSAIRVGASFTTTSLPFSFGVEGLNQDDWPDIEAMRPMLVDHDDDGNPGLTGTPFSGQVPGEAEGTEFSDPRLSIEQDSARAKVLYMAIRTRAALTGTLVSCDPPRLEGEVVPESLRIETRNIGCVVAQTGEPCDTDQESFIDSNLPAFEPNGTSSTVSIKVPSDTTCADVRALDF